MIGKQQIKSVRQIGEEMLKSKQQFQFVLNCLSIPNLTMQQDLVKRTPTMATLLNDLPSEQKLKEIMVRPYSQSAQIRRKVLNKYQGKYEIIHKAKQNIQNLKIQAQKLYYVAAQIDPYKIKNEYEHNPQIQKMSTFQVYNDPSARMSKNDRNTISPTYLRQLRQEQSKIIPIGSANPDCLSKGQQIVHINLYDSVNGQKVFEYMCHSNQTLLQIVSKFYCMIATLEDKQTTHYINSYLLLQENFYYYGNLARKKIQEVIHFFSDNVENQPKKYFHYEMDKVALKNVRVVFGRPYLFRHLDGCDHFIIFKDIRMLTQTSDDVPLKKDKYPLECFQGRLKRRKCEGCRITFAQIVSLNDPMKSGKHMYLCTKCHEMIHKGKQSQEQMFIRYLHD